MAYLARRLITLLACMIVCICNSGSSAAAKEALQGMWRLNFSPPYMVPNWRRNIESAFFLNFSATDNQGTAKWSYGNTPTDATSHVSASVAAQIEAGKEVSLRFYQPWEGHTDKSMFMHLKGQLDENGITGSVIESRETALVPDWMKSRDRTTPVSLPKTGSFTLRRLTQEEQPLAERLFAK